MATTLTKTGWFGRTSGAWSSTGSNTVVDTGDGIKISTGLPQVSALYPLNPISTGDGYLTLKGDATRNANLVNLWSNYGVINKGTLMVGNKGSNITGTGGYGIANDFLMIFGDGNNLVTGNGNVPSNIDLPTPMYGSGQLSATGIYNTSIMQFGNGNNTLTGNGYNRKLGSGSVMSGSYSYGNGSAGVFNSGSITFGTGNNVVNALNGGFDGDGYIEFGGGQNIIKGFGQVSVDGGGNAKTKLLLNPGTYQISSGEAGGPYTPYQVSQTGSFSRGSFKYAKMDITGIPLIDAANGTTPLSLKQGTYTVDLKGKITYDSSIGNDAFMVYDPSAHTSADLFFDNSNTRVQDPITGQWVGASHQVRFASTSAGKKLTLLAEDTGAGSVVIGTGTAASAVTTGKTALDVDASLVKQALTLQGNNGNNKITGGSGDDKFISSAGTDTLNGGSGSNTVDYSANPNGITVVYGNTTTVNKGGSLGTDSLIAIQNVVATTKNDTITGDANNNVITGGLGTDIMDGKDGSDTYVINSGAEHPAAEVKDTGTVGTDTVQFNSTITNDKLTLFAGNTGIEMVNIGTVGQYHIWSNGQISSMPEDGTTGSGTTALNIDASAVLNRLTISGNDGDNIILGSKLDNIIYGGNGIDTINGGDGNDTIFGGLGNDILTGGNGKDTFVFDAMPNSTTNRDLITDFASGSDSLCFILYGHSMPWNPALQNRLFGPLLLDYSTFNAVSETYGIDNTQFVSGGGVSQATTADQRFLYDTTSGILSYDRDGWESDYGLIQVAVLGTTTHPGLTSTDLRVKWN